MKTIHQAVAQLPGRRQPAVSFERIHPLDHLAVGMLVGIRQALDLDDRHGCVRLRCRRRPCPACAGSVGSTASAIHMTVLRRIVPPPVVIETEILEAAIFGRS